MPPRPGSRTQRRGTVHLHVLALQRRLAALGPAEEPQVEGDQARPQQDRGGQEPAELPGVVPGDPGEDDDGQDQVQRAERDEQGGRQPQRSRLRVIGPSGTSTSTDRTRARRPARVQGAWLATVQRSEPKAAARTVGGATRPQPHPPQQPVECDGHQRRHDRRRMLRHPPGTVPGQAHVAIPAGRGPIEVPDLRHLQRHGQQGGRNRIAERRCPGTTRVQGRRIALVGQDRREPVQERPLGAESARGISSAARVSLVSIGSRRLSR